ncbi:hypothetical protein GCM10010464_79310 [Pseudonocardia yunnanensis]|jgi:hypothetical protein|uniref:hypothetical protein n=1 Tax=Pseudonocardia yunnanensis TaxID=58107 RepID=UPI0031CECC38
MQLSGYRASVLIHNTMAVPPWGIAETENDVLMDVAVSRHCRGRASRPRMRMGSKP